MRRQLRRLVRYLSRQIIVGGFEPLRRPVFDVDDRLEIKAVAIRAKLPEQNVPRLIGLRQDSEQ